MSWQPKDLWGNSAQRQAIATIFLIERIQYWNVRYNVTTQPRPQVHIFGTKIDQFPNKIQNRFAAYFCNSYKVSGQLQKTG
jgi:hypothetical protein